MSMLSLTGLHLIFRDLRHPVNHGPPLPPGQWRELQGAHGERRRHMESAWLLQEAITLASEKILPKRCMVPDSKGPSPGKDLVPQMPAHR